MNSSTTERLNLLLEAEAENRHLLSMTASESESQQSSNVSEDSPPHEEEALPVQRIGRFLIPRLGWTMAWLAGDRAVNIRVGIDTLTVFAQGNWDVPPPSKLNDVLPEPPGVSESATDYYRRVVLPWAKGEHSDKEVFQAWEKTRRWQGESAEDVFRTLARGDDLLENEVKHEQQ